MKGTIPSIRPQDQESMKQLICCWCKCLSTQWEWPRAGKSSSWYPNSRQTCWRHAHFLYSKMHREKEVVLYLVSVAATAAARGRRPAPRAAWPPRPPPSPAAGDNAHVLALIALHLDWESNLVPSIEMKVLGLIPSQERYLTASLQCQSGCRMWLQGTVMSLDSLQEFTRIYNDFFSYIITWETL